MENIYNIHWERLRHMLVPGLVRGAKMLAVLKALLSPHISEYERFRSFAGDAVYRVAHNGSIVSLQDVLNDGFDPVERGIYIRNIERQQSLRFYSQGANKEVGFYFSPNQQAGFNYSLGYNPEAADFTVHVPERLRPASQGLLDGMLIRMRGQLDYYKLFAKKYKIEFY